MIGNCKLCGNKDKLKESHIIPKFVYKWMKETGSGYLRRAVEPNLRRQDGPQEYLLCQNCEDRFNKTETYFSNTIFYPYLSESKKKFDYDNRLVYFLISVLWRILINDLPTCKNDNHPFLGQLKQAEEEWRRFLLGIGNLDKFSEIHLFMTDLLASKEQPVAHMNQYLTRSADGTVVSNNKCCALYAKFSRFMIFGFVTPFNVSEWVNTKIENGNGVLETPQSIKNGAIGEFLADRARLAFEPLQTVSEKQRKEMEEHFVRNASKIVRSDLGKVLEADFSAKVDPHLLWKKVGRNEKCPCGSGKKYKHCHGR